MSATERIYVCARIELFQLYQKIVAFKLYKAVLELTIQSSHDLSKRCVHLRAGDPIHMYVYAVTYSVIYE